MIPMILSSSPSMPSLYFFAGDSYVRGNSVVNKISDLPAQYKGTFNNVKVWTGTQFDTLNTAINNNQFPVSQQNQSFSYHMIFAIEKANKGETVYLCTYGIGGSRLEQKAAGIDWDTESSGEYYDLYKIEISQAIAWMDSNVERYRKSHLNITLGTNDANEGTQSTISTNIQSLANGLRTQIGENIPILLSKTIDLTNAGIPQSASDTARSQLTSASSLISNCTLLDLDSHEVSTDFVHLSVNGLISLGQYLSTNI